MRFVLLVAMLSLALFTSETQAQWHTKTYHAKQDTGTASAQATVNIKNISPSDPDWKTALVNAQYAIRKAQAEAERQREENDAYLQALATLGVPGQGYSGASVAQSAAYGGNSIYGYSYSQFADYFNAGDRQVTLNQYQNAANRTLDLASQATDNMKELLSLDIAGQERVATIIAEGAKGEAIIRAAAEIAKETKNSHTRVQTTYQGPGAGPEPIPPPVSQQGEIRIASTSSCAKCHSGAKPPKGIILDGSSPLSIDQYTASVVAVDRGTMPPPDSGPALTQPQQEATIAALKQLLGN